jgi:hypothetical protein
MFRSVSTRVHEYGPRVGAISADVMKDLLSTSPDAAFDSSRDRLRETFLRDGVVVLPSPILTDTAVAFVTSQVEKYIESNPSDVTPMETMGPKGEAYLRGGSFILQGLINKGRVFEVLAEHPLILALAKTCLGAAVKLKDMSMASIAAGNGRGDWHPDWQYPRGRPECRSVKIFLWLDDLTEANGATAFVPGSVAFQLEHPPARRPDGTYSLSAHLALRSQWTDHYSLPWPFSDSETSVVRPTGPKGWGVVYDSATLHASGANVSPSARRILSLNYVAEGCIEESWGVMKAAGLSNELLSRQSSAFLELTHDWMPQPGQWVYAPA